MPIVLKAAPASPSPAAGRYVVDTFVRPALTNNMESARRYAQLAEGLSQFEKGFTKWRDIRFQQFTEEELTKSRQEWEATRQPWADYVREHPEAAGFSPWFRRGYMELSARNEAEELSRDILTELERNPEVSYTDASGQQVTTHVNDTDSPEALEAFLSGRMENINARFRNADPLIHAAAVAPVLEQTRAAAHDYQRKARAKAYEEGMMREFDTRFNILLDNDEATPELLNAFIAEFHDLGMTEEQANTLLLKAAAQSSMNTLSFEGLDAVADIPVQGGLMRQTSAWRDARAQVSRAITAENRSRLAAEATQRRARMAEEEDFFKGLSVKLRLEGITDPTKALARANELFREQTGRELSDINAYLLLESYNRSASWLDYRPSNREEDQKYLAYAELRADWGQLTPEEQKEILELNPKQGAEIVSLDMRKKDELGVLIPQAVSDMESYARRTQGVSDLGALPGEEVNPQLVAARAASFLLGITLQSEQEKAGRLLTQSEIQNLTLTFKNEVLPRYREFALDAQVRTGETNEEDQSLPSIVQSVEGVPGWNSPAAILSQSPETQQPEVVQQEEVQSQPAIPAQTQAALPQTQPAPQQAPQPTPPPAQTPQPQASPAELPPFPKFSSYDDFMEQVNLWMGGKPSGIGEWQAANGLNAEQVLDMIYLQSVYYEEEANAL